MTTSQQRPVARAVSFAAAGLALAAAALAPAAAAAASGATHTAGHARPHGSQPAKHHHKSKHHGEKPVVAGSRYLALGDSVVFGYREANSIPHPDYSNAKNFVGYPEDVGKNLGLHVTNAACPGETTASYMDATAQSNGCENVYTPGSTTNPTPGGYRTASPLHVKYSGSQMAFADQYLKKHPNTRLVSLMIGANDGFICQEQYADGCISEFAQLQSQVTTNVGKIFKNLRDKAHYKGQLVLVTYYSLDYSNSVDNYEESGLNSALEAGAKPYHVHIANGYHQFKLAAKQAHGNTCTAELLTALSGADAGTCGVHPSVSGQAVLAQAVERAIKK